MGSDNLFHKRKAKLQDDTRRKKASREAYEKVLIVCEGEKTEPSYFLDIKDYYEIHSANIVITGDCGSDPLSIYNYAKNLYEEELKKGDPFDRVYCVFDQDSYHLPPNTYDQALNKIKAKKPTNTFFGITSVPCFEYWILLHFKYTTAPYSTVGGISPGKAVLEEVNQLWPQYTKGMSQVYTQLKSSLHNAKRHATQSRSAAEASFTDNPTTLIDGLVTYLEQIK